MIIQLIFIGILYFAGESLADIYRYQNEEGVECYTDSPRTRNAVRILKEPVPARSGKTRMKAAVPRKRKTDANKSGIYFVSPQGSRAVVPYRLPVSGIVTSPVGFRHDPIDGVIRDHLGVDIAVPSGTPVRPVAPGIITFSGYRNGYGNTVEVLHHDGMTTLYAHNSLNIKGEGEPVDTDSTIAFSGSTGRTTGPHLHFEAWKDGENITMLFVPNAPLSPNQNHPDSFIRRIVQE